MTAAALCLAAAGFSATIPAHTFTLAWQHSIEKVVWEEDYIVAGDWLYLSGARIRGSGAGMEPPDGAVLLAGVWHYRPAQRWSRALTVARSEFVEDYRLCVEGRCMPMSNWIPVRAGATRLAPCGSITN